MASEVCVPQIQSCAIRVARLADDGGPDPGANNLYVSDALVKLTAKRVVSEGEDFELKNACGTICTTFKDCDRLKRYEFDLELCTTDPQLMALLTGGEILTDPNTQAIGFAEVEVGGTCPDYVSLEIWAKRIINGAVDPDFPYNWWVFPRTQWTLGDRTFENAPSSTLLSGLGFSNENWFDGPANDWPVASDRVAQFLPTTSLPTVVCGTQTLSPS